MSAPEKLNILNKLKTMMPIINWNDVKQINSMPLFSLMDLITIQIPKIWTYYNTFTLLY